MPSNKFDFLQPEDYSFLRGEIQYSAYVPLGDPYRPLWESHERLLYQATVREHEDAVAEAVNAELQMLVHEAQ